MTNQEMMNINGGALTLIESLRGALGIAACGGAMAVNVVLGVMTCFEVGYSIGEDIMD